MAGEVSGTLGTGVVKDQHINAGANIAKTKIVVTSLARFPIVPTAFRKYDAMESGLANAASGNYLGLISGTYGSSQATIQSGDLKATAATTRRARVIKDVPDNYQTGGSMQIRLVAGMNTTVADTAANAAVEAYLLNDDGTLGSNLVTTGNTSINSLTLAQYTFAMNNTNVVPGLKLDIRVSLNIRDAATGNAVIGQINDVSLYCDTQP